VVVNSLEGGAKVEAQTQVSGAEDDSDGKNDASNAYYAGDRSRHKLNGLEQRMRVVGRMTLI
jgi:hypothetical protein